MFSFNDSVYFSEIFCEDSTIMLLRILSRCGVSSVTVAGFDGFSEGAVNYYKEGYTHEQGTFVGTKTIQHILKESLAGVKLRFLTPSAYE